MSIATTVSSVPILREGPAKNIIESIVLGVVLTGLSYGIGFLMGWVAAVSLLEVFAVFTSYACTYLCVRERRINYPIGAASNAAYALLFYSFGLMGSAVVTAYLTFSLVYGWFRWKSDDNTKPVSFVEAKWWPVYLVATAIAFAGGFGLYHLLGAVVVWTDLAVMAGSILAQFLLDNKKQENWIVWAVVNVFAIYTYFRTGLFLVGVQYVFFLGNTVYGWVQWNKSRKSVEI
jgi:nicotinamide mononucleotide transporter